MRYVEAKLKEKQRNETYRIYVTDALKFIAENTAKFAGGSYMSSRYNDLLRPAPAETRTAEEVINNIRAKLGKGG